MVSGRLVRRCWFRQGETRADDCVCYTYNAADNVIAFEQGDGERTHFYYDAQGRIGAIQYHDGGVERKRYDASGNLVETVDAEARSIAYTYDGLNRVRTIVGPDGVVMTNVYDRDGNLVRVDYPGGVEHRMAYDVMGRFSREQVVGTNGGVLLSRDMSFDLVGNVTNLLTGRGVRVDTSYDALSRVTAMKADGQGLGIAPVDIRMTYTPNGWLQGAEAGETWVTNEYDQQGRLLRQVNGQGDGPGLSFAQTFDAEGRRRTVSISPVGEAWSYEWGAQGRVTNVLWRGHSHAVDYDQAGRIVGQTAGPLAWSNGWDIRNRQTNRVIELEGIPRYREAWGYAVDNLRKSHDVEYVGTLAKHQAYTYDALKQLEREVYTDGAQAVTNVFDYDAGGNRIREQSHRPEGVVDRFAVQDEFLRVTGDGREVAGTSAAMTLSGRVRRAKRVEVFVDGVSQGLAVVDPEAHVWTKSGVVLGEGVHTLRVVADPGEAWEAEAEHDVTVQLQVRGGYAYDPDGNLVYANRGNQHVSYQYDALGRLVGVTMRDDRGSGWNWSAAYDALGRRAGTSLSDVIEGIANQHAKTRSLFDPAYPMQEVYRIADEDEYVYVYGPDTSGSIGGMGGIGGLVALSKNGDVRHVLSDIRGNVLGVVDGSTIEWQPPYHAFGPSVRPIDGVPSFATRSVDPTGLIYMGSRYYDPVTGRFLSPDPARFADSRNLYVLCGK